MVEKLHPQLRYNFLSLGASLQKKDQLKSQFNKD